MSDHTSEDRAWSTPDRAAARDARDARDVGAAVVEMAMILVILAFFLFAIISFGFLFSFRQNMTQAAAEGARAGAVAASATTVGSDASLAVRNAIRSSFGKDCGTGGLTCLVNGVVAGGVIPATACNNDVTHECITVELRYDYKNNPLLPDAPLVAQVMPSTIAVSSTARVS